MEGELWQPLDSFFKSLDSIRESSWSPGPKALFWDFKFQPGGFQLAGVWEGRLRLRIFTRGGQKKVNSLWEGGRYKDLWRTFFWGLDRGGFILPALNFT